ncbi:MAG TPA: ATP-binding protein [Patescibacteria group bacterium]|nr:ATP-binding protein [Patescibacteria group bacterium]
MALDKKIIEQVVLDQRKTFEKRFDYIPREVPKSFLENKKISVISGVRRSGKSTLLKQISQNYKGYYYLNFEDDRLIGFENKGFATLYEIFLEAYGKQKVFFFDEIQNVYGWEKFVRRLFDNGYKIFVTGSNAKLLSSELATSLTGRHLKIELYPFSFQELLKYKSFETKKYYTTEESSLMNRYLKEYIEYGGFPEIVKSKNKAELRQIYQDILIKDLLIRFNIKETKAFKELSLYLLSNISSLISFNNLKKVLEFNSVSTVKSYIDYLEESYINFSVPKYDYSLKKQIINDRKIYAIDTGLVNAVSFAFSENKGKLLENLVFIELKNRNKEIFYHKDKYECDFVLKEGRKIVEAIQVTDNVSNSETKEREINGLLEALNKYNLNKGTILVFDGREEEKQVNGKKITFLPLWKWLLAK